MEYPFVSLQNRGDIGVKDMNWILKFDCCWSAVQRNFSSSAQTERQPSKQAVNNKVEMIGVTVLKGIEDL